MPVQMNSAQERVWKYLLEHKTPVSAERLAKYFIRSKSSMSSILKKFADDGIVDVIKIGTTHYYRIKE